MNLEAVYLKTINFSVLNLAFLKSAYLEGTNFNILEKQIIIVCVNINC